MNKVTVDGALVYDPRTKTWVTSDNPALIMGYLLQRGHIITSLTLDEEFWENIKELANFCETKKGIK